MNPHIFLINLNERPERLANTISQLEQVNLDNIIIRQKAYDPDKAKSIKHQYINEDIEFNISDQLTNMKVLPTWGALGCAISHFQCWKNIVEMNLEYAIILEDDNQIIDESKFKYRYNAANDLMKRNNDIKLLISLCSKTQENYRISYINNDENLYKPVGDFIGTSFYFINYNAAKYLLRTIPIKYQIDIHISRIVSQSNNDKFRCLIYKNSGIVQSENFKSDVQYHFLTINELHILFKYTPTEMLEKIYFFLPHKEDFRTDDLYYDYNNYYNYDNYTY